MYCWQINDKFIKCFNPGYAYTFLLREDNSYNGFTITNLIKRG